MTEQSAKNVLLKNRDNIPLIPYVNPASTTEAGLVKVDGTTITINNGVISSTSSSSIDVDQTYDSTSTNAQSGVAIAGAGFLTSHQDISSKQDASTAVTHTANTSVGGTTTPVYIASDGKATALSYTIATSVPSGAVFTDTDTKYTAGSSNSTSKLYLIGATSQGTSATNAQAKTTYSNSSVYAQNGYLYATTPTSTQNDTTVATTAFVKSQGYTSNAGTVTSVNSISPVNGNVTLSIPTITDTYSATSSNGMSGKAVASAISNFVTTDTKNTAGSTDTSSKIYLIGATSQGANPQTYSHDTAFVDANGRLNSAAPATSANDTTVATTKWVKDQSYTSNTGTITGITMNGSSKGTSGVVDLGTVITSHQDISGKEDILKTVNVLSTSGTITLTDNSINSITPSAAVTFSLPTVSDNTKFHQILVQVKLSTVKTITLGTSYFFNKTAPDLSTTGVYNLVYEYDKANQYWVVGCIPKGSAS